MRWNRAGGREGPDPRFRPIGPVGVLAGVARIRRGGPGMEASLNDGTPPFRDRGRGSGVETTSGAAGMFQESGPWIVGDGVHHSCFEKIGTPGDARRPPLPAPPTPLLPSPLENGKPHGTPVQRARFERVRSGPFRTGPDRNGRNRGPGGAAERGGRRSGPSRPVPRRCESTGRDRVARESTIGGERGGPAPLFTLRPPDGGLPGVLGEAGPPWGPGRVGRGGRVRTRGKGGESGRFLEAGSGKRRKGGMPEFREGQEDQEHPPPPLKECNRTELLAFASPGR